MIEAATIKKNVGLARDRTGVSGKFRNISESTVITTTLRGLCVHYITHVTMPEVAKIKLI